MGLGRWGLDEMGLGRWGLSGMGLWIGEMSFGRWVRGLARWINELVGIGEAERR